MTVLHKCPNCNVDMRAMNYFIDSDETRYWCEKCGYTMTTQAHSKTISERGQ